MPHIFESWLDRRRYNDDPIKALTIHFIFQLDHMTICDNRLNQFRQLAQRAHNTITAELSSRPNIYHSACHVPNRFDRSKSNSKRGSMQFNSIRFNSISFVLFTSKFSCRFAYAIPWLKCNLVTVFYGPAIALNWILIMVQQNSFTK